MTFLVLLAGIILGVVAAVMIRLTDPSQLDRLRRFDLTATIVAVVLVAVTLLVSSLQLDTARRAEQTEDLGRLIQAAGGPRESRILAIAGLQDYAERYPEARGSILRQMSSNVRYLSRHLADGTKSERADREDELRVALGALRATSMLDRDEAMPYDIADVQAISTPLPGFVINAGYARGANFSFVSLRDAVFTCTSLQNANMSHADLTGATIRGADVSGLKLDGARGITKDTFVDVFWYPSKTGASNEPKWQGLLAAGDLPENSVPFDREDPAACRANYSLG